MMNPRLLKKMLSSKLRKAMSPARAKEYNAKVGRLAKNLFTIGICLLIVGLLSIFVAHSLTPLFILAAMGVASGIFGTHLVDSRIPMVKLTSFEIDLTKLMVETLLKKEDEIDGSIKAKIKGSIGLVEIVYKDQPEIIAKIKEIGNIQ